jgi:hypothetical protein
MTGPDQPSRDLAMNAGDRAPGNAMRPRPLRGSEMVAMLDPVSLDAPHGPQSDRRIRAKLLDRVSRSVAAGRAFVTVRRHHAAPVDLPGGASVRTLYRAAAASLRPGEPSLALAIELTSGAGVQLADESRLPVQREWLVLAGEASVGAQRLTEQDFHLAPAGEAMPCLTSRCGALLYLRESPLGGEPGVITQRDAPALWQNFAPGIRRRLMWSRGGEAAMLYRVDPGTGVARHGHRHDEECLVLAGELFLDDLLLRPGEYQVAPAGTVHGSVYTDTGALLYARGDLELEVLEQ